PLSHVPLKSGWPSDRRGTAFEAAGSLSAPNVSEEHSAMPSATMMALRTVTGRLMTVSSKESSTALGRVGRQLEHVAVGVGDLHHEAQVLRAIARGESDDLHRFTVPFEHGLREARLARHADRRAFERPGIDLAVLALHVEVDVNV